jgi:ribonuclease Z
MSKYKKIIIGKPHNKNKIEKTSVERFNPYSIFKCVKNINVNNVEYNIYGNSVASVMSCLYLKQLDIMFDAGANSPFNPKYILITHIHGDHTQALSGIIIGLKVKPIIYCPTGTKSYLYNYLLNYEKMTKQRELVNMQRFENKFDLREINVGDMIEINNNKIIVGVKTFHGNCSSIGYGLFDKKKKLKDEYKNCSADDLIKLKKEKIIIDEEIIIPVLLYTGDTTIEWTNHNKINFPLVITESTYIESVDKKFNEDAEHQTLGEIMNYAKQKQDTKFILTHFSPKYTFNEIMNEITKHNINNVDVIC